MHKRGLRIPVSHFYFQQDTCWVLESESLRLGGIHSHFEPSAKEGDHTVAPRRRYVFHGLRRPLWPGGRGKRSWIWRCNPSAPGHSFDLESAYRSDDRGTFERDSG